MPLQTSTSSWLTAFALLLSTAASAVAGEGIVRISDADSQPGVVRMSSQPAAGNPQIQRTAYAATSRHLQQISAANMGQMDCNACGPGGQMMPYGQMVPHGQMMGYGPGAYGAPCQYGAPCEYGACGYGDMCDCVDACPSTGCCDEGCKTGRNRRGRRGKDCDSCDSFGECHEERMLTLFAKPLPKDPCGGRGQLRRWRGHQLNYLNRNQRLANHLFGWLVPSGCCGQGCPPIGKYCVNYADDPGYADSRDGQAYGAQGYGVPVTVPLAPNVRHSYNYSWGTPSSRITPMGQYSGSVAGHQQLYHQSW